MESSLSALKLSGDRPLTRELGAERMEKKPEHGEHAADRLTSKIRKIDTSNKKSFWSCIDLWKLWTPGKFRKPFPFIFP